MSKKNLSQLIMALKKTPQEEREQARKFIPFMILQMQDEDLKKLSKDYKGEVERTGNTRLPDEIRDNGGRGGRGRFVRKTIILYSIFYKTPVCLALLYQANKSLHRLII